MEPAIRLCYSPLPSPPLCLFHGAKGSSDVRATRFHLKFNHATPSLPHFSTRHPVASSFGHVNCMLDRFSVPSENEENSDNKILRGATAVSLALACVLGLFNVSCKLNPKLNTAYAAWLYNHPNPTTVSSQLPGAGGDVALGSVLKTINAEHSYQARPKIDREPDMDTVETLKLYAVSLSRSGKETEAREVLKHEYKNFKNTSAGHSLGLAWVELLIFQGNFEDANKQLDYQIPRVVGDGRRLKHDEMEKINKLLKKYESEETAYESKLIAQIFLYKAIIHTMLKNKEAAKWWEAFITTLD